MKMAKEGRKRGRKEVRVSNSKRRWRGTTLTDT